MLPSNEYFLDIVDAGSLFQWNYKRGQWMEPTALARETNFCDIRQIKYATGATNSINFHGSAQTPPSWNTWYLVNTRATRLVMPFTWNNHQALEPRKLGDFRFFQFIWCGLIPNITPYWDEIKHLHWSNHSVSLFPDTNFHEPIFSGTAPKHSSGVKPVGNLTISWNRNHSSHPFIKPLFDDKVHSLLEA